mgnify:CR=1 FL=1
MGAAGNLLDPFDDDLLAFGHVRYALISLAAGW